MNPYYHIVVWPTTEGCFMDIALLLQEAVCDLGYRCTISNKFEGSGNNIVLGANVYKRNPMIIIPGSIIFNMEQLYDASMWNAYDYRSLLRTFPVWDYTYYNLKWLEKECGIKSVPIVELGYSIQMEIHIPRNLTSDIDVLFYGGYSERRKKFLVALQQRRINCTFFWNNLWGEEKRNAILRAKIVINIHYDAALFEYPRVLHLLNNKKFVVSEDSVNREEYYYLTGGLVITPQNDPDAMAETVEEFLRQPEKRDQISAQGYALIKERKTYVPLAPGGTKHIRICHPRILEEGSPYQKYARSCREAIPSQTYTSSLNFYPHPGSQNIVIWKDNKLPLSYLPPTTILVDDGTITTEEITRAGTQFTILTTKARKPMFVGTGIKAHAKLRFPEN